jgi:hypothetical protein
MTNIIVLDREKHRALRVERRPSARHGDNQRFVQVVVREFPLLAIQCPILVSKDADTGAFFCGAMLGFDEGENLFLSDGGGHEGYRPLNLQRAPFYVAGGELAVDLDSPRIAAAGGERVFDEAGQPTAYLESIRTVFGELRPGLEMTKAFLETLLRHKLLAPLEVELSFDDGSSRELTGLYTIDQEALRSLPDATVVELFRQGYMYLIHLMIVSVKQISSLASRKNSRLLDGGGDAGVAWPARA